MKKILLASSEAVPFIKTGGLADVVGSLPRYIDAKEYDVRIILPLYACMRPKFRENLKFVGQIYVNLNWRRQYAAVYKTVYRKITCYFIDNEYYFSGDTVYGRMERDIERFAFFSKAVLDALTCIDFKPDVIHCNDWQTGLVPVFLRTFYALNPIYKDIKTVYSIHNLKFQGRWNIQDVMDITGLPRELFQMHGLEAYGDANYLKGGVVYSDMVTTVSPTYAKDITTLEGGEGLHGVFAEKMDKLVGILNGIDYSDFDPSSDPAIYHHYDSRTVGTEKCRNKARLQKLCQMPVNEDIFTIGIVSRLTDQKGFDLVAYALEEMLTTMNLQIYVLGTGDIRYETMFSFFERRYPDKLHVHLGYSEELANRIYASCDAFLMPSRFEPCGLSQMMSMRYGTIPIVRETGGLKDTVEPYNEYEQTGTGFSFEAYDANEMLKIILYAADLFYYHPQEWLQLQRRAMETDFSWAASAREYQQLYSSLLSTLAEQK